MAQNKKAIQARISQIAHRPETRKTALFAAASLLALAAVFTFGGGEQGRTLTREGFLTGLEETQSVTLDLPALSGYTFDPIADEDLLGQVRELLGQAKAWDRENSVALGFQDLTSSFHTVHFLENGGSSAFYLYTMGEGGDYVLARLDDAAAGAEPLAVLPEGTVFQLEELARQQEARNRSIVQVEYPEFKSVLTDLFLGDDECVARNDTPEHDMEEWLTRYTSFYEVSHCSPWWLEDAPMGWYARAMDAGSWYTISIPDHLVEEVQAVCAEQAAYPSLDTVYSALENTDTIYYAPSNTSTLRGKIQDPDVLQQITQLLLTSTGDFARQYDPGRSPWGRKRSC